MKVNTRAARTFKPTPIRGFTGADRSSAEMGEEGAVVATALPGTKERGRAATSDALGVPPIG
jgi:hypothetical protein